MSDATLCKCLSRIEARYLMRGRTFTAGMADLFVAILRGLDDQDGARAVMRVCVDSPHPPELDDIRRLYAEERGMILGETPEEAMARQENNRRCSEQVQRQVQERRRAARSWGYETLGVTPAAGPLPASPDEAHAIIQAMRDRLAGKMTMPAVAAAEERSLT